MQDGDCKYDTHIDHYHATSTTNVSMHCLVLFSVYTLKTTLSAIYHLSPAFAWQGTSGDISADVFSTSEPSAWRSLVEITTSIQGHATQ